MIFVFKPIFVKLLYNSNIIDILELAKLVPYDMESISSTFFYAHIFLYKILAPKFTKPNVTREKLLNLLSYEKGVHNILMRLTLGGSMIQFVFWSKIFSSWPSVCNKLFCYNRVVKCNLCRHNKILIEIIKISKNVL